jgi:hypothetical protein
VKHSGPGPKHIVVRADTQGYRESWWGLSHKHVMKQTIASLRSGLVAQVVGFEGQRFILMSCPRPSPDYCNIKSHLETYRIVKNVVRQTFSSETSAQILVPFARLGSDYR